MKDVKGIDMSTSESVRVVPMSNKTNPSNSLLTLLTLSDQTSVSWLVY